MLKSLTKLVSVAAFAVAAFALPAQAGEKADLLRDAKSKAVAA